MKRKEKMNLRHFCSNRKSKGKHNSRMSTKTKETISRLLCWPEFFFIAKQTRVFAEYRLSKSKNSLEMVFTFCDVIGCVREAFYKMSDAINCKSSSNNNWRFDRFQNSNLFLSIILNPIVKQRFLQSIESQYKTQMDINQIRTMPSY